MADPTRWRINTPNVVGEEFEGEVVAVNLESGTYFSLLGSAADIWQLLSQTPASAEEVVAALTARFDGIDMAAAVEAFLAELLRLELVVATEADAPNPPEPAAERTPFELPRVEAFNDLQDILLLDPIHDVDEAGWPMTTPPPA